MNTSWTNVRYFSTFEEADKCRLSLKTTDTTGTLQVKVKRCGLNGTLYVVKTRQSAELIAAQEAVDVALEKPKATKKAKKAKN